jgi:hypothetical protein
MQRILLVTAASTLQTGAAGDKAVTKHRLVSPKEASASFACGVSHDGTCINGVSIGDGRNRPCVWERPARSTTPASSSYQSEKG